MSRTGAVVLAMMLAAVLVRPAAAQVEWDGTMLLSPGTPGGIGLFLVDPDAGGLGAMGTWRRSAAPIGFGLRAGLANDAADDLAVFGGLDLSGTLLSPTSDTPIGAIWLLGAGIGIGHDLLASFPAGISLSSEHRSEGVLFRPYVTPRVDLDLASGPGDNADLSFSADLGLDLSFAPNWMIRFGASVGRRDALAIGLAFPGRQIGR